MSGVLIGVFALAESVLVVVWMLFVAFLRNLLLISANTGVADELNRASGVIGVAAALSVAVLLAARWRAATPGVRRASSPAAARGVTLVFLSGLLTQGAFTDYQSLVLVWPTPVGLIGSRRGTSAKKKTK